MLKIESQELEIQINPFGAEISSIYDKTAKREYLWQADKAVWNRHAPILFPVVGRIAGDSYIHKSKKYFMQKHGFARNSNFEIISSSPSSLLLRMKSDESTKAVFPFDFELDASFEVTGKTLRQKYTVRNVGADRMYFSIGAHPGFFCKFGDILRFEKRETMKVPYLNGSDVVGNPDDFIMLEDSDAIALTPDLFEKGSLTMVEPISSYAEICTPDGTPYLREEFGKVPTLWLWAAAGAEYICIEPWFGSDERFPTEILSEKKGIMSLGFDEKFEFPVTISVL